MYKLAENCQHGALQEEMIRDRLVVGILHHGLSEKLQMDSALTLEKAVVQIRQHEDIKKQQCVVRETNVKDQRGANIDFLKFKKKAYKDNQPVKTFDNRSPNDYLKGRKCGRCGKTPAHSKIHCPAREAECRKC